MNLQLVTEGPISDTPLCLSSPTTDSQARGESYRPSSSLSAPVTRFDGRPRARDRPKPRRRPRPKEPEESRRSRSAPATGAPTTPQPPAHTAHNEGFLYRKTATASDLEVQQRSPNRYRPGAPGHRGRLEVIGR